MAQMGEVVSGSDLIAEVEGNFPELTLEVGRRLHLEDAIVVEWTCNYGDGRLDRNVSIAELRNGEAITVTDYWGRAHRHARMAPTTHRWPRHAPQRYLERRAASFALLAPQSQPVRAAATGSAGTGANSPLLTLSSIRFTVATISGPAAASPALSASLTSLGRHRLGSARRPGRPARRPTRTPGRLTAPGRSSGAGLPPVELGVVMGPIQRPGRALCGPEKVHPPHGARESDRDAGVDRSLRLGPVDQAEFQSDSPLGGFLTLVRCRVDEVHVSDDDAHGFEPERCEHRVPFLVLIRG